MRKRRTDVFHLGTKRKILLKTCFLNVSKHIFESKGIFFCVVSFAAVMSHFFMYVNCEF